MPRVSSRYGCGKLRPKRIPTGRARGGESNTVNESARARTKRIFGKRGIDWEKSIRPGAGWASTNENGRCEDVARLRARNPREPHFSFSFGSAGAGADFGAADWASVAAILAVAALLILQLGTGVRHCASSVLQASGKGWTFVWLRARSL